MLAKKSCLLISSINIVGLASSIFLFSSLLCSSIDINSNLASGQGSLPMVPSVKIVSPESGQQVPISISNVTSGTNANVSNSLSISGTASDDANSPCEVSVLLNDVRPYQPATPQGNSGKSDYSNWQFLLTPDYAPIKQGENKITAKLECLRSPANLTKWYSVSVTGVTREQLLLQEQQMIERAKANAAKINQTAMFVTIESHEKDQYAPIGPLTISGASSDDIETDCEVYIDWNDLKPFQKAQPKSSISDGSGSQSQSVRNDYSNWTFTFAKEYHEIVQGTNELTAKLDCLAYPNNYTKFSSINITGAPQELILQQQQEAQLQQQQMIERAKGNTAKINQTAMIVTIESPAENQSVPMDSDLTISGTSSDN